MIKGLNLEVFQRIFPSCVTRCSSNEEQNTNLNFQIWYVDENKVVSLSQFF